jgi:hypothetical protein
MVDYNSEAFLDLDYSSPADVYARGLNPEFWRWGLTFNQGNEMSVSEERVRGRLAKIAAGLLRQLYGNKFRNKARIRFIGFQHGSVQTYDRHFHVLMAIEGEPHALADAEVAEAVQELDKKTLLGTWGEKLVHVDCGWTKGNSFHSYVSRYVQADKTHEVNWFTL